jgi:hypothetical protein
MATKYSGQATSGFINLNWVCKLNLYGFNHPVVLLFTFVVYFCCYKYENINSHMQTFLIFFCKNLLLYFSCLDSCKLSRLQMQITKVYLMNLHINKRGPYCYSPLCYSGLTTVWRPNTF